MTTNFNFNLPGIKQKKLKKIPQRIFQNKSEMQFRNTKETLNQSVTSLDSLPDIQIPKVKPNVLDVQTRYKNLQNMKKFRVSQMGISLVKIEKPKNNRYDQSI